MAQRCACRIARASIGGSVMIISEKQRSQILERLMRRSKRDPNGCLVWGGCRQGKGYGAIFACGKLRSTHRIAYQIYFGKIPAELSILHRCDNRPCIEPQHLYAGTAKQNSLDAILRGRTPKGIKHGMAKLSEEDVYNIRMLSSNKTASSEIAVKFGVSYHTIWDITTGRSWRHI